MKGEVISDYFWCMIPKRMHTAQNVSTPRAPAVLKIWMPS